MIKYDLYYIFMMLTIFIYFCIELFVAFLLCIYQGSKRHAFFQAVWHGLSQLSRGPARCAAA